MLSLIIFQSDTVIACKSETWGGAISSPLIVKHSF